MPPSGAVLVTGGSGLVGAHAVCGLLEPGARVVIFDVAVNEAQLRSLGVLDRATVVRGDVLDLPHLLETVETYRVGTVVHLASFLGQEVNHRPYAGIRLNLLGTVHVLEAARLLRLRRVVFASSSTVLFGALRAGDDRPLTEEAPPSPPSIYATTKLAGEHFGANYAARHGFEFAALRFAALFGPGQVVLKADREQQIAAMIRGALRGEPVEVEWTAGVGELLYMKDAARAVVLAALAERLPHRIYHIGNGALHDGPDVARAIEREIPGAKITVTAGARLLGYPERIPPLDFSRAREELGYEPAYPLERAIPDYIAIARKLAW